MNDTPDSDQILQDMAATMNYSLGRPRAITLTPDGAAVLFLRGGPRDRTLRLYEFTAATGRTEELLTPDDVLHGAAETLSVEEKARRERQRQLMTGFTSFALSDDGAQILLPLSGKLFVVRLADRSVTALPGEGWLDGRFSPDGRLVAGVKGGELCVADIAAGTVVQITHGATPSLTHGVAEFVAQEEMDRYAGFWWSPDSETLAYEEADLGDVEALYVPDPLRPEQPPIGFRYPRAGTPNARVRLGLVPRAGGTTTWVAWDTEAFPYLARVVWPKAGPLTLVVQSRPQTHQQVLAAETQTGETRVLLAEQDPAWLNLERGTRLPLWREDDGSGFFWPSERTGEWRLELRDPDGGLVRELTPAGFGYTGLVDVDEAAQTIVVSGGSDPCQHHLYRFSLDGSAPPEQISAGRGSHSAQYARNHALSVRQFSLDDGTVDAQVCDAAGDVLASLPSVAEAPPFVPEFERVTAQGQERSYDAVILRPRDFQAGRSYPVILSVYAGPTVKVVHSSARGYLRDQWVADQGYIVVSLDGRGTPGHGRDWERAVYRNLIDVALDDQIDGLQALGRLYPELDLTRVGVSGWSFGGYFAAMATLRRPDVFRAGVAGAPVTDWHEYDTCYTERYMDLPERNPDGYRAASALTYADQLERPLLLIHGVTDDNVYFVHTLKLCEALFRAGKPYDLLPMTGTHMAGGADPVHQTRLWGRILAFFGEHLG